MVFCNQFIRPYAIKICIVTILILIDGFLQFNRRNKGDCIVVVTILILIDGFLQLEVFIKMEDIILGHNPYFNRWFSAMTLKR